MTIWCAFPIAEAHVPSCTRLIFRAPRWDLDGLEVHHEVQDGVSKMFLWMRTPPTVRLLDGEQFTHERFRFARSGDVLRVYQAGGAP